jgi:hydrogenase maturation protease
VIPRILVAGIGNIFLGDDGFGCEVVRRLVVETIPPGMKAVDYGIRGLDLAYALLEPYDAVIFVDAIARGDVPGTIYLLELSGSAQTDISLDSHVLDPHSMDPPHLMAMARSLGEIPARIFVVGCEPQDFGDELEGRMELSPAVAGSVREGVRAVLDLVANICQSHVPLPETIARDTCHLHQGGTP